MTVRLDGRIVLVTGANAGIGRGIAGDVSRPAECAARRVARVRFVPQLAFLSSDRWN